MQKESQWCKSGQLCMRLYQRARRVGNGSTHRILQRLFCLQVGKYNPTHSTMHIHLLTLALGQRCLVQTIRQWTSLHQHPSVLCGSQTDTRKNRSIRKGTFFELVHCTHSRFIGVICFQDLPPCSMPRVMLEDYYESESFSWIAQSVR